MTMAWRIEPIPQTPTKTLDAWCVYEVPFDGLNAHTRNAVPSSAQADTARNQYNEDGHTEHNGRAGDKIVAHEKSQLEKEFKARGILRPAIVRRKVKI